MVTREWFVRKGADAQFIGGKGVAECRESFIRREGVKQHLAGRGPATQFIGIKGMTRKGQKGRGQLHSTFQERDVTEDLENLGVLWGRGCNPWTTHDNVTKVELI